MKKQIDELVEKSLKTAPEFTLPKDFSYKVIKAFKAKEKKAQRKIYIWMILGVAFMSVSGILLLAYYFPNLLTSFSSDSKINNLIPMAVVVGVLVVLVQYLDKILIKDRFSIR